MNKNRLSAYGFGAFAAGTIVGLIVILRFFDPQPSNPTITVTNEFFGVATFTVTGTATSANRLAAALACVRGEIPWNLAPIRKLTEDKVQQIRKLEEKLTHQEQTPPISSYRLPSWWLEHGSIDPGHVVNYNPNGELAVIKYWMLVDGKGQWIPIGTKLCSVEGMGGLFTQEYADNHGLRILEEKVVGEPLRAEPAR